MTELPPPNNSVASMTDEPAERRKRIRRLVILIVLVSVGIHLVAGIGAGIWVIARYLVQPKAQFVVQKQVQMDPQDREHRMKMEELTSLRPKPVFNNRIQSLRPSTLALPELPRVPLETITPIDTEALVADQVEGIGQHGQGSGDSGGFFGGKGAAGSGLLAGSLYDLKRDGRDRPTAMATDADMPSGHTDSDSNRRNAYLDIVNKLANSPSTESALRRFYRAPDTLFLSRIAIPLINADGAPKEFKVADKVKPRYWIAVYKGRVTAPDTGNYRFIGFADDILLVKINGRLVFDGSILNASRLHKKEGTSFGVEKGKAYEIEVILGEGPGGRFAAWLQIQKQSGGEDPYWFRMSEKEVSFRSNRGTDRHIWPTSQANGIIWWPASKTQSHIGTGL